MSYEDSKQTKMLATDCCVCGRPLCDSVSVEMGIGPECRRKYGFNIDAPEENRKLANQLVYAIACNPDAFESIEKVRQLRNIGFTVLAEKIAHRMFSIVIKEQGNTVTIRTPYTEAGVNAFRGVPTRRWDKQNQVNVISNEKTAKNAAWAALKKAFPGYTVLLPNGDFVQTPAR